MRKVTFVCDVCGKESQLYNFLPGENDKNRLFIFKKFELCGDCAENVYKYICQLKSQSPTI